MNLTKSTQIPWSVVDMIRHKQVLTVIFGIVCMMLLILDPSAALKGASAGIEQCTHVILPSLFPYFFITAYLNSWLIGTNIPGIHLLSKLLHIPNGGDSILLLGMIGGYPVGAQTIADTYQKGKISHKCAQILLGYCSNAGPAFIFGVTSYLFSSAFIPWLLWIIQLLAMIITGLLLPRPTSATITLKSNGGITAVTAIKQSIRNIAYVCGWIILFKTLLSYAYNLSLLTKISELPVLLSGALELSNGCLDLANIQSEYVRFLLCSVFLSFGGLCVLLQTKSAVGPLGLGCYIPGKIIQASTSYLLSITTSCILFSDSIQLSVWHLFAGAVSICAIIFAKKFCKNKCGN